MHFTHLALHLAPDPAIATAAAVSTVQLLVSMLWPVAIRAASSVCWDCWLHVSALGRIGGCYLLQQPLAEVTNVACELSDDASCAGPMRPRECPGGLR